MEQDGRVPTPKGLTRVIVLLSRYRKTRCARYLGVNSPVKAVVEIFMVFARVIRSTPFRDSCVGGLVSTRGYLIS